jgi:hypothetical protein
MWEREGLARTLRLDFEKGEAEVQLEPALSARPPQTVAAALGGMLEGFLGSRAGASFTVEARAKKGARVALRALPRS